MLWLVGSGSIAVEYAKVLNSLSIEFIVIGRGKSSSQLFSKLTGIKVNSGGISIFLDISGTKHIVVVSFLPLWPPASKPSTTIASTPESKDF